MLKKEIKFIYLFFVFCFFIACSHTNNDAGNILRSDAYVNIFFTKYSKEYKILNDSVYIYIDSMLKDCVSPYFNKWQVDSMICLNSNSNKLVATINESNGIGKLKFADQIEKIFGKKINNKWYFFWGGGSLTVPRNMYGKDEMHPLTFHELSQIARKEFLNSALIKNDKGEYVVNDKWVDAHFYYNGMCGHCKTKEQYDSTHWYKITHKWNEKIDTNEYKPLRRNKMNNPAL